MNKFGIVVIGYNRVESIQRLMKSLLNADYIQNVDLIISIDKSENDNVEKYAKEVKWPFGNKIIKTFSHNLGLKKHVLTCGNYINEFNFDALIILEDDLVVAPNFFNFSLQAVKEYANKEEIAGISLYSHSWNINADRPFMPIYKGKDVFFMQYAQSWGQVWMKKQWNEFYLWYISKKYKDMDTNLIPENVLSWPESSWLKYHIEYCVDMNKYFVYPYTSLSSNFADAGTHYAFSTNKMQVPLDLSNKREYKFPEEIQQTSIYDAFFENKQLAQAFGFCEDQLCVDFFGKKRVFNGYKYLITTKSLPYKVIKKFGLQMRPWELNIIYDVPGEEIILYDLSVSNKNIKKIKHKSLLHWLYDTRGEIILKRNFIDIIFHELSNKIRKK